MIETSGLSLSTGGCRIKSPAPVAVGATHGSHPIRAGRGEGTPAGRDPGLRQRSRRKPWRKPSKISHAANKLFHPLAPFGTLWLPLAPLTQLNLREI